MSVAPASAQAIAGAAHISTITQLVLAERECRDMGRWERMKACYHPDSQVRIAGQRAVATMGCTIDIPAVLRGVAVMLSSHARVFYRAELRDGAWGLMSFEVFYMRDELAPQVPGEIVPVKATDLAGFRQSYRFMSHVLTSNGFAVRDDLAGEDRPETVQALGREIYAWAGLPP